MRILVLGGTKFFGKQMVHNFLRKGWSVSVFSRQASDPVWHGDIEHIHGDRTDYKSFYEKLRKRNFDVVIDNIAYNQDDVKSAVETFTEKINQYILTSSVSVYRFDNNDLLYRPLYEEDAYLAVLGDHPYNDGKRMAEKVLWSIPEPKRPFPFTIMRPSLVEGPNDPTGRSWFWIQRLADCGEILCPVTAPSTIFRHAYVDDVADAFFAAVGNPTTYGKAYNLAGEEIVSLEDYVYMLREIMESTSVILPIPISQLSQENGLERFNPPFSGSRFIPDISRAKSELLKTLTPLRTCLQKTVAWHLQEYKQTDSQGYDKRKAELAAAQKFLNKPGLCS